MPFFRGVFLVIFLSIYVAPATHAFTLKSGDVLLQPLHCYLCNLIEAQTNSSYSHVGIVVSDEKKLYVLEAWQTVRLTPLDEFLQKTQKGEKIKVLRHRLLAEKNLRDLISFAEPILGNPYDSDFLFDNYIDGKKAYYCSELVYEALKIFTDFLPSPLPMPFDIFPEAWDRYFGGKTPRGELGIAPANFEDETFFKTLGTL